MIDYAVGNEIYMVKSSEESVPSLPVAKSAEEYVAFYKACDDAIRAFAPDVRMGAIGGVNTGLIPLTVEPDWMRIVVTELGDRIDFVDLHNAYAPVLRNVGFDFKQVTTDDEYAATFMAAPEYVRDNLAATKEVLRRYAPDHAIEIHITEYGPLVYPFRPGGAADKISDMAWNRNLAGALYLASLFHLFAEEPRITSANHLPLYQGGFGALVGLEWHAHAAEVLAQRGLSGVPDLRGTGGIRGVRRHRGGADVRRSGGRVRAGVAIGGAVGRGGVSVGGWGAGADAGESQHRRRGNGDHRRARGHAPELCQTPDGGRLPRGEFCPVARHGRIQALPHPPNPVAGAADGTLAEALADRGSVRATVMLCHITIDGCDCGLHLSAGCHWLLASQCMRANPVRSICASCIIAELGRQRIDGGQTPRRASFVSETRRAWDVSSDHRTVIKRYY